MRQVSQWLLNWGCHEIWIVYIFWSAYVRGRRIVFCEFFFQIFFRNIFLKKFVGISSGNSHLLSSALEMILTFLWTAESSSSLSDLEEELDDWHGEDASFWLFSLSSLIFSCSLFMESLLPRDWAEQFLLSLLLLCC